METAIFLVLLVIAAVLYFRWRQKQSQQNDDKVVKNPNNSMDKDKLWIENVEAGGVINLTGIGPNSDDYDVMIIGKHLYSEGGYKWYELEGDNGTDKVWIEYERDDDLEVSITLKKLKLKDIGISKQDLEHFDDEEEGEFTFDGIKYEYDESGKAKFQRNCNPANTEKMYYWDFEGNDNKHLIGVEKWEGDKYEVSLSEKINLSQITVFSLRKDT